MRMRPAEPTKWDSFTVSAQVLPIWVVTPPPLFLFSVSWLTFTSTTALPAPQLSQLHSCLKTPPLACQQALLNPQPYTTPSPIWLHTLSPFLRHTHAHPVLFLSSHWSVTEATWQVTHTLDVIRSGPDIQPLEWWETVTRIVYLCCRRGEVRMTEKCQISLRDLRRTSHVEFVVTTVKNVETLRVWDETDHGESVCLTVRQRLVGAWIEVVLSHFEKCAGVRSQIDVALLSALSIDFTRGNNEITNWMCPLVNNLWEWAKHKHTTPWMV